LRHDQTRNLKVKAMEAELWEADGGSCRVQGLAGTSKWFRADLGIGRGAQARSLTSMHASDRAS
jgi:hypothetical protein